MSYGSEFCWTHSSMSLAMTNVKNIPPINILPIATIQPTFPEVLKDVESGLIPEDRAWLSLYKAGEESVHANVHITLDEEDRNKIVYSVGLGEDTTKDITFEKPDGGTSNTYHVTCASLSMDTSILYPEREFLDPEKANTQRPSKITAFDVSPDGSQFATGFLDGSLHIYPISYRSTNITAKAVAHSHASTVTSLRFFPSSRVILSASSDFTLSIVPAEPSDLHASPSNKGAPNRALVRPARTLKGHTGSITSTAVVSRGRNVLSGSRDASVRLWDVSSGAEIRRWRTRGSHSVEAISLSETIPNGSEILAVINKHTSDPDPREVETACKLLFLALSDGSVEVITPSSPLSIGKIPSLPSNIPGSRGLTSIISSSDGNVLLTGSAHGVITAWDVRYLSFSAEGSSSVSSIGDKALTGLLGRWRRNDASVEDLAWVGNGKVAIGTSDGLPYVASIETSSGVSSDNSSHLMLVKVDTELVGTDCDPVRFARYVPQNGQGVGSLWTAADDAIVRQYFYRFE